MSAPGALPTTAQDGDLLHRLATYRRTREEVERRVLPLATSVDGVTFEFQCSLHDLQLRRGGYVVLQSDGVDRLGQVTDLDAVVVSSSAQLGDVVSDIALRLARGSGALLATDGRPFHDAVVRPADPAEVADWCATSRPARAGLTVGELLLAPGVPATLDSGGLTRHTFLCGQSGSGKTYALGLLLERVLAETTLRVVVLDPNSDHVGLGRVRPGADPALAERYAGVPAEVAVWRNDLGAQHQLRLRFPDLDPAAQAAVLGLDPVGDRDEYSALLELLRRRREGEPLVTGVEDLRSSDNEGARRLGVRAENLGVLGWSLWGPGLPSIVDEIRHPTSRCTVVDLGSLDSAQEQRVVSQAVLTALWEERRSKVPCLVVIDEAHNVCPAEPRDELSRRATERSVQIAAEGRKYGLYLLTSTQQPHKVHENVVSQCDNVLLMRINSRADLADLTRLFSFVPEGLIAGCPSFGLGQVLVGGRLLPQAAYVRMGHRVSMEGGADIPPTWAAPRPDDRSGVATR
ncbi:ATP-binding protein [Phycicoccus sp. M110.8]|uniref:ATP-binding protein n=1 Tax=Phycicoccus sp. M110.8 TaxID=3075433 RepID=UPI0028FD8646|nr:ATP-binding protein [Phycicoccus sp. M110.8]MDU0314158.1 ATP-binding protein [Phycicoccus sp. M110.8]